MEVRIGILLVFGNYSFKYSPFDSQYNIHSRTPAIKCFTEFLFTKYSRFLLHVSNHIDEDQQFENDQEQNRVHFTLF